MSLDLSKLTNATRLLFSIPLQPVQGQRFQPTGFPNLGAATYTTKSGASLLVESAQSMANRIEMTLWDEAKQDLIADAQGLSHVRVLRKGKFFTDTILESHRINSPYLLMGKDQSFFTALKNDFGGLEEGPIDRALFTKTLLKYDIGSLLHGAFLAKKELAGGRLRLARAISAFIEADGVRVAASGGVKNDHVNPRGETKTGFGNVPFARDEYTADRITLYVNIDLSQIRGYGLGVNAEALLTTLVLYKLRALVDKPMRLRTACDFELMSRDVAATNADGFLLPSLADLAVDLKLAIKAVNDDKGMQVTEVKFDDELKAAKDETPKTNDNDTEEGND